MLLGRLFFVFLLSFPVYSATWEITYPRAQEGKDPRLDYPVELLSLMLEHTGVKYQLKGSERVLLQKKALALLAESREINVIWSMTDEQREKQLLPIRIPIYKGLIGWRLLVAKRDNLPQYTELNTLNGLRDYLILQGADWPDTKILQANGFGVRTGKDYLDIYSMLGNDGDFFPRSVVEVYAEMSSQSLDQDFAVIPDIGIMYPSAVYFFVNKNNVILAKLLQTGLQKAIESGEFDALFERVHKPILKQANMDNRKFYQLSNPLLPELTPLSQAELWYKPQG